MTLQDLIDAGLYKALAIAFVFGDAHRKVSHALLAKVLGARPSKSSISGIVSEAREVPKSLGGLPSRLAIRRQ